MKKNFWTWLLHDKKKEKSSICMKICLCIAVFLACGAFRSVHAQTEKLTLKRENASMLDIIFAVEKQSKMTYQQRKIFLFNIAYFFGRNN